MIKARVRNETNLTVAPLLSGLFSTKRLGIPAVAVNGDTWNARGSSVRNAVLSARYMRSRLLIVPTGSKAEVLPGNPNVSREVSGQQPTRGAVQGAQHPWGHSARLSPPGMPAPAISTTMPPKILGNVRATLGMNDENSFHLNLGNDKHNTIPLVRPTEGGVANLAAFNFVVRGRDRLLRKIIYFNDECRAVCACNNLRRILPPLQMRLIDVLHTTCGPLATKDAIECFRSGEIHALCTTGVVGMVCTLHS